MSVLDDLKDPSEEKPAEQKLVPARASAFRRKRSKPDEEPFELPKEPEIIEVPAVQSDADSNSDDGIVIGPSESDEPIVEDRPLVDDERAVAESFAREEPTPDRTVTIRRRNGFRQEYVEPQIPDNLDLPMAVDPAWQPPPITPDHVRHLRDWITIFPSSQAEEAALFKVRVERLMPKYLMGHKVSGMLGDIPLIDDTEFARRFGGELYRLTLEGPDPRRLGPNGEKLIRGLGTIQKYEVPGMAVPYFPQHAQQQQPGQGAPMMQFPFQGQAPTQVQVAPQEAKGLTDIAQTLLKQQAQMMDAKFGGRRDDSVVEQMGRMAERQVEATKESANATIEFLRSQADRERDERRQLEERVARLSENNPQTEMMKVLLAGRNDGEAMDRIRRDADERIEKMRRDADDAKQRQDDFYTRQLNAKDLELKAKDDHYRAEIERREHQKDDTWERRVRDDRDMWERRLDSEKKDHERQMKFMQDSHERAVSSLTKDHEREIRTIKATHESTLEARQMEMDRLRTENASLKAEVETYKREVYKDTATKLNEARQLAQLTGMVDKEENGGDAPQGIAQTLANQAPQLLGVAGQVLGPMLFQRLGIQMPQQGPPQMGGAPPPQQLGPGPQAAAAGPPGQAPRRLNPQRRRPMVQVPDDAPPVSYDMIAQPAYRPPPPQAQPTPPPAHVDAPTPAGSPDMSAHMGPAAPAPAQPPPPPPPPPPQQQAAQASAGPDPRLQAVANRLTQLVKSEQLPVPQEYLAPFAAQATQAFNEDMAPADFAKQFVGVAGPYAFAVIDWTNGEGAGLFLDLLTEGKANWNMAGPKQWIANVWQEIAKLRPAA